MLAWAVTPQTPTGDQTVDINMRLPFYRRRAVLTLSLLPLLAAPAAVVATVALAAAVVVAVIVAVLLLLLLVL